MLGLKITAPRHGIFEFRAALLQKFDGFGVGHLAIVAVGKRIQAFKQCLVHKAVEKFKLLLAVFKNVVNDIFDHIPCKLHIVVQIRKRDFRLNHPKFRRMARRVGVFRTESRSERVDLAIRKCIRFSLQLTGNRQIRTFAEEVLGIIDFAVLGLGNIGKVKRGHAEHFARALAIGSGDKRRVNIDKIAVVEERVNGIRHLASDAEHRRKQIGSRTKIRLLAQIFHRMALLLERIIGCGRAFDGNFIRLDFKRLLVFRRENHCSGHDKRRADILFGDFVVIGDFFTLKHDLHALEAAAVVQIDKAESLAVSDASCPTAECDGFAVKRHGIFKNILDDFAFHGI